MDKPTSASSANNGVALRNTLPGNTNGTGAVGKSRHTPGLSHDNEDIGSSGIGSLDISDSEERDSDESSSSSSKESVIIMSGRVRDRHHSFGALSSLSKIKGSNDLKKVRFADALGLDLVTVKLYDAKIDDLFIKSGSPVTANLNGPRIFVRTLTPLFRQPGSSPDFLERLQHYKVSLENAYMDTDSLSIRGIVRVLNMDYHKAVYIRWTMDDWRNMMDYRASYVNGSNDRLSDKFQFKLYTPLDVGQSLIFAVRYHCVGQQFWDNNHGQNYKILCTSTEKTETEDDSGICMSFG